MFVCMDAILYEEKGSPWGELSPVGRLRVNMEILLFCPIMRAVASRATERGCTYAYILFC